MYHQSSAAFVGASWVDLGTGLFGYLIGLWRSDMLLNEKGFYLPACGSAFSRSYRNKKAYGSGWAAHGQLASVMIGTQWDLYTDQRNRPCGGKSRHPFIVSDKIERSDGVTTFHADGGPVGEHVAGQYLSARIFIPRLSLLQPRQNRIASDPTSLYSRILAKREIRVDRITIDPFSSRMHAIVQEGQRVDVRPPADIATPRVCAHRRRLGEKPGLRRSPAPIRLDSLYKTS